MAEKLYGVCQGLPHCLLRHESKRGARGCLPGIFGRQRSWSMLLNCQQLRRLLAQWRKLSYLKGSALPEDCRAGLDCAACFLL